MSQAGAWKDHMRRDNRAEEPSAGICHEFSLLGMGLLFSVCAVASCVGDPYPCPAVVFQNHTAVGGEISWSVGDRSGSCVFDDSIENGDHCWAKAGDGRLTQNSRLTQMGEGVSGAFDEFVSVGCATPPIGSIGLNLSLGDPRDWEEGTVVIPCNETALEVKYTGLCESNTCEYCLVWYYGGEVTVTVEEVAGGPGPFPDVVTDDFRRVYTIHYAFPEPVFGIDYPKTCGVSIQLDLWLRFTVGADDFVQYLDAMCSGNVH